MMSKYNLCIIDDKIPVEQFNDRIKVLDTGIIDENILINYLSFGNRETWGDSNLYNLIKNLKEQRDIELALYAFKTHSFYFNYIDENLFSPDIVIFDWDVGTPGVPSEESLKRILEGTYCLVAIYTEVDTMAEIELIINADDFKKFKYRLFVVDKKENDSAIFVINKLKSHLNDFSFKYGNEFKRTINFAINATFCKIGEMSFSHFIKVFGENISENGCRKYGISSLDFIEIMNDQIKAHLISSNQIEPLVTDENTDDVQIERQLWHYRMFHKPQDNIVRKGDIVWHETKKKYYFIISSDCHLSDFWKKNLGFIIAIPLYKAIDTELSEKLIKFSKKRALKGFSLSSLVNPQNVNITIIPAMDNKDDYIIVPKELETFNIPTPKDYNRESKPYTPLKYEQIDYFDGLNRLRLNEPFLGALIQYILRNISDIGVPDYSEIIQKKLTEHITKLSSGDTEK
jgi:hypothetical protein